MKKTLTVNISGMVFHIDEDAYLVLNDYLESIRKHFSSTPGGEEIHADIESRIAEMLKDRVGKDRQVITLDDIEAVIKVIGMPEEFGDDFQESNSGGPDQATGKSSKRLYRDPDNEVIGGVCGGLGAYFHTDPVWFRVGFAIAFVIGFGAPLLIYIILWAIIPVATTTAEKLEMRGERVNVSNIEKSIREEINHLKDKFNAFSQEARRTYKKKSATYKSDFEGVGNTLGRTAEIFVRIILIFVGIVLLAVAVALMGAFLVAIFGFGHPVFILNSEIIYLSFPAIADFFIGSASSSLFLKAGLLLLIGIPLFMIIIGAIKLIFGLKQTRYLGLVAFNVWMLALIVCIYYGYKVGKSFSHKGVHEQSVLIALPDSLLILDVATIEEFDRILQVGDYVKVDEFDMILTDDDEAFYFGVPCFEVQKNTGNSVELDFTRKARGKSDWDARQRASHVLFNFSLSDNRLTFDPYFKLDSHEIWREQRLEVLVKIPVGYYLRVSDNLGNRYEDPALFRLTGKTWKMTGTGLVEVPDFETSQADPAELSRDDQRTAARQANPDQSFGATLLSTVYSGTRWIFGYLIAGI